MTQPTPQQPTPPPAKEPTPQPPTPVESERVHKLYKIASS